ncbi:hypothetical protein [Nitratifractor salsuginis]|uniref:Prevent-host-death family protein n=1 Tax=Nitratifractor salsuginis (strain DSM 16511 / JCM 12458 / E9I37-1) TaxID=749222 RepID=E6X1V1_NITSE|nr:hypothetical protein [Nitratifractor salsuginis]ADV45959.1 hypothetical protein Nitsa_0692 [Nitratifractor salsuginis DSM 16511]
MKYITVSDVVKKPSIVTNATEVTLIEDAKRHIAKSVVIPYALYKQLRSKLEEELYLLENAQALNEEAYEEFLEIESVAEDLGR